MNGKEGKENPAVFISYSHDSPEHADKVLAFANKLRAEGIDAVLDQYEESPPEGWPMWMDRNIRDADFVLMICTEIYYKRVMGEEESGKGLGVRWEGKLIYQHIYQADAQNTRFLPILFNGGEVAYIPNPVQDATRYYVDTEPGYENLYRRLTNQPRIKKPDVGEILKLPSLPERKRRTDYLGPSVWFSEQWPETDPSVFGRDDQLKLLDDTWEENKVLVLSFVAAGGVGKTALVNRWKNFRMAPDKWRGAERVFGWSFYSQGSEVGRQVSGDPFIDKALRWFGDEETANSTKSPWDKGQRLGELVKQGRNLLLLDGLEPLQEPPGSKTGHEGKIKDQGVAALLRSLTVGNKGLCVISTRIRIEDLKSHEGEGGTAVQKNLDDLTKEMGAEYLKSLGVHGTKEELLTASEEYGNNALALTLLGNFLRIHRDRDICKRAEIANVLEVRKYKEHAQRVMAFYEEWFKGKAELELLYVLGLFDRPVEKGGIDAVCGNSAIKGLTEKLNKLTKTDWDNVLDVLREARLIAKRSSREKLDCHPLIREHFGEKLKDERIDAWREGHGRLYKYYKGVPEKEFPDTLEEMEPLFRAVYHGCAAGKHQETFDNVYYKRIYRGDKLYSTRQLGAFGSNLGAVACFFERCWDKPVTGLNEYLKALVLNEAGFALRALGRLREATEPMEGGLQRRIRQNVWLSAARIANNLSETYLALGEVNKAVDYGQRCIEYADKSKDEIWRVGSRSTLADALHQLGKVEDAERLFVEAERIQKKNQPEYWYLYSMPGYKYCDLLLVLGKYKGVKKRARRILEWAEQPTNATLLDIALHKLSVGQASLLQAIAEKTVTQDETEKWLDEAVDGLRKAGTQDLLPLGLFARAGYYRVTGDYEKAWGDLEEAHEIAERGEMKLWLADYHLESSRVCLDEGRKEDAKEHYEEAKRLIEECGYHRRDKEVEELE